MERYGSVIMVWLTCKINRTFLPSFRPNFRSLCRFKASFFLWLSGSDLVCNGHPVNIHSGCVCFCADYEISEQRLQLNYTVKRGVIF